MAAVHATAEGKASMGQILPEELRRIMKIRRTVKQHYYDYPTWPIPLDAGKTEIIDEVRMEHIIQCNGSLSYSLRGPTAEESWERLKTTGKLATFYADYELLDELDEDGTKPF